MKIKHLLTKTLLVAAGLCVGASAWATETNATLDHTASVKGGSNALTGTVDQDQEYYNNDATSGWIAWAFAQFSFSLPDGENITKAELTWKATSAKGYNTSIYYLKAGKSIDYESVASVSNATDYKFTDDKTLVETVGSVQGGQQRTTDVTNAVKAIVSASQSYIIFQFTGNAGSANLYGKANADKPTLVITTTSETTYNVTFAETNSVAAIVKIGGVDVTGGTALVNGTYDFTATATGYKDYAGSFTVEGAAKEVTFTMTPKTVYSYTVKAVDGESNNLGIVASGSGYEDENVTYYYPEFVMIGSTLYKVNQEKFKSKNYWCNTGTLDSNNKEFTVTYGDATIEDVVFYKEAEEMDGFTAKTTNNATVRCSNGTGGIVDESVKLVTLPKGKYTIFGQVWGTNGLTAGVSLNGRTVWSLASTGSLANSTSEEFNVPAESDLYVYTTGGNDNHMLDLIYIVKTGEGDAVVSVDDIKTTGTTFASAYAIDCANLPAGVTAYKVASIDKENKKAMAVKVTEAVAAGTGLILVAETAGSYNIPVAATGTDISETNLLKAAVTATEVAADQAYGLSEGKFVKLNAGTIPAGKAYLLATSIASAPELGIDFGGTTAITTTNLTNNTNIREVYNLNGQRVAQPTKGLYIVNGKKAVIK